MTDSTTLNRFEKQHVSRILWPSDFKRHFIRRFGMLEILDELPADSKICDFGSGTGRLTPYLVSKKFKITNFEPTAASFLVSRRVTELELRKITIVKNSEILNDNYFDLVVSIGVIHHLKDPIYSLNEIKRISKQNVGQIAIWVYAKQNKFLQLIINAVRLLTSRTPHSFNLTLSTLISLIFFSGHAVFKKLNGSFFQQINDYRFRDFNLMIYDQLQPPYSKYYLEEELVKLMAEIKIENYSLIKSGFGFTVIFRNE